MLNKQPRHATRPWRGARPVQRAARHLDTAIGFVVISILGAGCGYVLTVCLTGF